MTVDLTPSPEEAEAQRHAGQAERLLSAAGKPIFQGVDPMVSTRKEALMRAGVHAALANYYAGIARANQRVNLQVDHRYA